MLLGATNPCLCGHLEDPDERVGYTAAQTLGRTEDERALPALERMRDRHPSVRLKTYAQEAIARIRAGSEKVSGAAVKT